MVFRFLPDIFKSYIKCGQILLKDHLVLPGAFFFSFSFHSWSLMQEVWLQWLTALSPAKGTYGCPASWCSATWLLTPRTWPWQWSSPRLGLFISPRRCGRMAWGSRRLTPNRKRNWTQWKKCLNVFSCFTANVCVYWFVFQGDLWQKVWVTGNVQISIANINFFEHHCNLSLYNTLWIIDIPWRIHCAHMQKHTVVKTSWSDMPIYHFHAPP